MSTSDIGGSFGQVGGSSGISPSGPVPGVDSPSQTGFSSQDSISASDLAAALMMMWTINSQNPVLSVPKQTGIDTVLLNMGNQYHKICMNMLDSWADSIKKVEESAKEIEKSPAHQAKVARERANRLELVDSVRSYADQLKIDNNDAMLGSLTTALVITGLFTGVVVDKVVDVSSTALVGVTPQIDFAAGFATQALYPLAGDFRAELGLIGAWAMGTLINFSTLETVAGKQNGKVADDRTLADKYATKILTMLSSEQLNNFIAAMLVHKTENGQPLSNERKEELSATLKMILLASALAAVYKSKTGKVTGQEFLDLASGKMTAEAGIEKQLVDAIQIQLSKMSSVDKANILGALASYMDKDPKLTAFFDVGKTFENVNEELGLPPDAVKS